MKKETSHNIYDLKETNPYEERLVIAYYTTTRDLFITVAEEDFKKGGEEFYKRIREEFINWLGGTDITIGSNNIEVNLKEDSSSLKKTMQTLTMLDNKKSKDTPVEEPKPVYYNDTDISNVI